VPLQYDEELEGLAIIALALEGKKAAQDPRHGMRGAYNAERVEKMFYHLMDTFSERRFTGLFALEARMVVAAAGLEDST
jgi:hypothetical protein